LTTGRRREAIVRATIALGHDLGFEVVGEGVEDRETWELLGALGCDVAQGYHIARPMPPADVLRWLGSWDPATAAVVGTKTEVRRASAFGRTAYRHVRVADDEPAILEMIRD